MSHTGAIRKNKKIDEYECSGIGPRPPAVGEESRMTECGGGGGGGTITMDRNMKERIREWRKGLDNLLCDKAAVNLLKHYVESEAGNDNINLRYIEFYFLCEGLSDYSDERLLRKIIDRCYK